MRNFARCGCNNRQELDDRGERGGNTRPKEAGRPRPYWQTVACPRDTRASTAPLAGWWPHRLPRRRFWKRAGHSRALGVKAQPVMNTTRDASSGSCPVHQERGSILGIFGDHRIPKDPIEGQVPLQNRLALGARRRERSGAGSSNRWRRPRTCDSSSTSGLLPRMATTGAETGPGSDDRCSCPIAVAGGQATDRAPLPRRPSTLSSPPKPATGGPAHWGGPRTGSTTGSPALGACVGRPGNLSRGDAVSPDVRRRCHGDRGSLLPAV